MFDTASINSMKPDRKPDFVIGPPDDPYMERWWIIPRNPQFNIYYHRILHDDDDRALHDHPWESFSFMTKGRLREITEVNNKNEVIQSRLLSAGECVFRSSTFKHRLELIGNEPAETLFITGPKVRDWGFHCPQGFVLHNIFCDYDNPGQVGRGCGET